MKIKWKAMIFWRRVMNKKCQQFLIVYQNKQMHRIRLNQGQTNNQSFSHQQSVNQQFQPKHKKKSSVYQKPSRTPNYHRIHTDQKQSSAILKNQPINSYAPSISLVHSASKAKAHRAVGQQKKIKKAKQTISYINLGKNAEEYKGKTSSTATKRKQSSADFTEKVKEKLQDFKIISTCLQEYVKEERRNNSEANLNEIIKIISAFNRSEIASISKPLEKLIAQIVNSIQFSLPQPQLKSILKKSISFQSPPHHNLSGEEEGTVKKGLRSKELLKEKQETVGDVKKLEQNLNRLKYESNRLKHFLQQVSNKNLESKRKGSRLPSQQKIQEQKLKQLRHLKEIAQQQARIIQQLQDSSQDNDTFRQASIS